MDIEGSTTRTNPAKAGLREAMYVLLEQSMLAGGIAAEHRDSLVDRGDGILALIHPVDEAPKTLLLSTVVPTLGKLLAQHAIRNPEQQLRLRAVLHAGEVHYDGRGCFGESLDVAFRLLDAPEVKRTFRRFAGQLLLVASDLLYRSVIRHGYAGIDESAFVEVAHVTVAGQQHRGWVYLPERANGRDTGSVIDVQRRRALRLSRAVRRAEPHEHLA